MDETSGHDRIMKAEILRELGQFDEAIPLLTQPFDNALRNAVSIIKDPVTKKDQFVAEITSR